MILFTEHQIEALRDVARAWEGTPFALIGRDVDSPAVRLGSPLATLVSIALLAACAQRGSSSDAARDTASDSALDAPLDVTDDLSDAPLDAPSDLVDAPPDAPSDAPLDADGPCRPGLSLCGAGCINLAIDNLHCGGCERRCQGVEACAGGRCQGPGSPCGEGGYPCCADAGTPCVAPLVCELGVCTAAARACGHRGEACCPGALVCEAGTVCSGGLCR